MLRKLPWIGVPLAAGIAVLIGNMNHNDSSFGEAATAEELAQDGTAIAAAALAGGHDDHGMLHGTQWSMPQGAVDMQASQAHFAHAEGWDVSYGPQGMYATDADGWSLQARAVSVSRDNMVASLPEVDAQRHDGLVEYHRGMMVEWYDHSERGVHHGMTFAERPAGEGDLQVELSVQSALKPSVFADNVSIVYRDAAGNPALAYDGLLVVDAEGRMLPSQMKITETGLRISVDDETATYPVTIDPVFERVTPGSISLFVDRAEYTTDNKWKVFYGYAHYGVADDYTTEIPLGPENRYTSTPVAGPTTPPTLFHAGRHVLPPITLNKKQGITWTITYEKATGGTSTKTSAAGNYKRKISPIVENGGCSYSIPGSPEGRRTEWGYFNRMPFPLTVPYGGDNRLSAPSSHGGDPRPTVFLPGRHVKTHTTNWLIEGPTGGSRVVWILQGRTATAGADRVCEPVNSPPVAGDLTVRGIAGGRTISYPPISDPDGDAIAALEIVDSHLPGGVTGYILGLSIRFDVPNDTEAREAWVSYRAQDALGNWSNVATVTLSPIEHRPYIGDLNVTAESGEEKAIALDLQDTDDDGKLFDTMQVITAPQHGTLTGVPGETIYYTPNAGYTGPDQIVLRTREDGFYSDNATIHIDVQWPGITDVALVSRSEITGQSGTDNSYRGLLSNDERFAYFISRDDQMASEDGLAGPDIFRRDLMTGDMELMTVRVPGLPQSFMGIGGMDLTPDGRYLVFSANGRNLHPDASAGYYQIFLMNTATKQIELVSRHEDGTVANTHCFYPTISDDGNLICFQTSAHNLTDDIYSTYFSNIFIKNRNTNQVTMVTKTPGDVAANQASQFAELSGQGNHVTFTSKATNLAPGTTPGAGNQILLYEVHSRNFTLISRNSAAVSSNGQCQRSFLSRDGSVIAFASNSSDLTSQGGNGNSQVFVSVNGSLSLVSKSINGDAVGNSYSFASSLSADGSTIGLHSNASDLVPNDTNGQTDSFVYSTALNQLRAVSINLLGELAGSTSSVVSSPDGSRLMFESAAQGLIPEPVGSAIQMYILSNPQAGLTGNQ